MGWPVAALRGGADRRGRPRGPDGRAPPRACARIANTNRFQRTVAAAIIAHPLVLGLETYAGVDRRWGDLLSGIERGFLVLLTIEIGVRVLAYGRRPWRFAAEPWSVLGIVLVGAGRVPGIGPGATALRLVRILRVVRTLSIVSDLGVVVRRGRRDRSPRGVLVRVSSQA